MFGGCGVFRDGLMFALKADGILYLKADDADVAAFHKAGCEQFHYRKGNRDVAMGYWSAPLAALEDPGIMAQWARRAHACAQRQAARKARGKSGHDRDGMRARR